ncbi:flavonol 7-O-rhamnosyltransferase-like [Tripterygium wilfordii]|uniref:flavonol 7-O-rhamnosyltransferase-like n=1 Tax=Tripterygium wilfordii TaxID=458696 RepID=UPI0018F8640F|nr:flavonol 7-O-rhamnosyltransferase-like [Tripterygium wilfordii]
MDNERVWAVGPLVPIKAGSERGGSSSISSDKLIGWLDSCQVDRSVVYVGFGTQITLKKKQMEVLANALEQSGVRFIWAVKAARNEDDQDQSMVPEGFEDRVAGRGIVIKGWAPQAAILEHRAVGAYLTHGGWNSVLEALRGGVILLAWPMQIDHFHNAKLFVDELGAAVRVCEGLETVPDSDALTRILTDSVSVDAPERIKFMELREKALKAIGKGGSSYKALDLIVEDLFNL